MLLEPTINKLLTMKLSGMVEALEEQRKTAEMASWSFEDRLALLVERQWLWKEGRALSTRLRFIDDWGLEKAAAGQYRDFLEVLDDRHGGGSTLITSQFPPARWHELVGDATVADAILDRLIHGAHRIDLNGESMRKQRSRTP